VANTFNNNNNNNNTFNNEHHELSDAQAEQQGQGVGR